jgi:hypothetical protein
MHKCSLFGLGWLAIDECGGKLDIRVTTRPINTWLDPIKVVKNKSSSTGSVPKPEKAVALGTPCVPDEKTK